ncbi:HAD-IA family hydrolase [Halorhodospira halophila]|uniref:HAD-superfamily hydrolase, subfamily IA, variant 3 n=1 Tax=Halorhodospira halophila (strain DSM 244 / SL1) TaxID=349124 RepID=A1WX07_HALHL|nr:HAD-IA family hydrolase [Halorhodospira halophila]ABM62219.1 HAD-superfamily hydrolase, subfamily IA, variant 3 [Halorhodospira halophila SL1]MBK1729194.1 phosphatase [Halorhodospira halophila]
MQALLFDVDGTLADTEGAGHLPAFNAAFEAFGLPHRWDENTYRRLLNAVPGGRERLGDALSQQPPPAGHGDIDALARQLHETKNRFYAERLRTGCIPPRPGIERIIAEARQRDIRLAVVTTSARANVEALFNGVLPAPLQSVFEVYICGDDVAAKKPDPEAYLAALRSLRLPARAALAVEDSVNGLRAARAAGIPTLITHNLWTRDDDFTGAAAVIDDLDHGPEGVPMGIDDLIAVHSMGA